MAVNVRVPALAVSVLALLGVGFAARATPEQYLPELRLQQRLWMPAASNADVLTETWFCPGMPATGADAGSVFRITNRLGTEATGTILLYNEESADVRLDLSIPAFGEFEVDPVTNLPGEITGAVVEIEGIGTIVEQVSSTPDGNSLSACTNETSANWYLAEGFTVDGSRDRIILSNPYDQPVVAELTFAVADGIPRESAQYSSMPIPARSVRTIDLGTAGGGAQDEPLLAVSVRASRGQLVVGRVENFAGGDRAGVQVSVASPVLSDQWRFAGGRKEDGVSERYVIYNPTEEAVTVEPVILGNPLAMAPVGNADPLEVPAIEVGDGQVVEFVPADVAGFPDGTYGVVFSTLAEPSIVVERVTTQTIGGKTNTSVVLGAIARSGDNYLANQWQVPKAPEDALADALVVQNLGSTPGTFTVYAIGAEGAKPVLTDVALPSDTGVAGSTDSSIVWLSLDDPALFGRPLVIEAPNNQIIVERWYRSGRGDTRTSAWALPTE